MTPQPLLKTTNFKNLTGVRFGKLTVIHFAGQMTNPSGGKRTMWYVQCDCGNVIKYDAGHLRMGRKDNCGCVLKYGQHTITHGASIGGRPISEYNIWASMKERILNPNYRHFLHYGGRGITLCARWRDSFESFLADMGPRPSKKHSIDRINNNAGYEPGNCRWATRFEQANNKRCNVILTHGGMSLTVAEWSRKLNINEDSIRYRMKAGWTIDKILTPA